MILFILVVPALVAIVVFFVARLGTQPSLMTGMQRTIEVYFENGKAIRVELNATDSDWVYTLLDEENIQQRLTNYI